MKSLQKDFLKRSIAKLENLVEQAQNDKVLSPELIREAFRVLHTIKGTAQTFGFTSTSKIAHKLENRISELNFSTENLLEGIARLTDSFTETVDVEGEINDEIIAPQIVGFEDEFLNQFVEHERKIFLSEVERGKNIVFVNGDFDLKFFADEFMILREKLSETGEIIATLPKPSASGKIGFKFFMAVVDSNSLKEFSPEIVPLRTLTNNDLEKILQQIAKHGNELAKSSRKDVKIEFTADKIYLSREKLVLIFEILLHLIRNAIDHAFTEKGRVELIVKTQKVGLKLLVTDNGVGIDISKIRDKAIEKKLISPEKILTESEILDLIFSHEFSTAEVLTEISGRGVGLDAVKYLTENAGGLISVKSRRGSGTTFEVILPYE